MSEHDEADGLPLLPEMPEDVQDWLDTLVDEPASEEVLASLGLPSGTEVTLEHIRAFLTFGRLERGQGRRATGVGRHYERLTKNGCKVRAVSAYEMRLKHHSFGQIAGALVVSRSTACRLVRQGMAVVFPSAAQLAKERDHRTTKRGRGRPRKDDALVPDRVLYKCH